MFKTINLILLLCLTFNQASAQGYVKKVKTKPVLSKSIQIANRHYLVSTFISIFGNSSKPVLNNLISTKVSSFGGPCDVYAQIRKTRTTIKDFETSCHNRKENSKEKLVVKSSLIRSGYIVKTCKSIIADKVIMKNFFEQNKIKNSDNFDGKTLTKIHNLFFPVDEINLTQKKKMQSVFELTSKRPWHNVVYAYCLSPSWKVI